MACQTARRPGRSHREPDSPARPAARMTRGGDTRGPRVAGMQRANESGSRWLARRHEHWSGEASRAGI